MNVELMRKNLDNTLTVIQDIKDTYIELFDKLGESGLDKDETKLFKYLDKLVKIIGM